MWFYLVVNAVLLGCLLVRCKRRLFVAALGLSGLCYALAYVPFAASCHFRFDWWQVLVTLILPIAALLPDPVDIHPI